MIFSAGDKRTLPSRTFCTILKKVKKISDNIWRVWTGACPCLLGVSMNSSDYCVKATFHDEPSAYMRELGSICEDYFQGEQIDCDTFYREIFPPDTIEHYHRGTPEPAGHKGNPLVLCQRGAWMRPDDKPDWAYGIEVDDPAGEYHTRHSKRILFNDYKWLHDWKNLPDCQHVWVSGLTYIGKARRLSNAVSMHALIFDLDIEHAMGLRRFFDTINHTDGVYPIPNYVVLSGTGVHLYYVFQEPIPLYHGAYGRKVKSQLNTLKTELTKELWNPYTIDDDEKGRNPQFQGINQAFRMVGSYTKSVDLEHNRYQVIAYKFPQVKLYDGLDYFYQFVRIPEEDHYKERSALGIDFWKKKNPEWYERRIVQKDKSVKYWHMSRGLYDWWLKTVKEQAKYGHRYNCLFCTVVYGVKCDIPEDEIEQDLNDLLPILTERKPDDPMTRNDVYEAMDAYTEALNTYPVRSIEFLSGIDLHIGYRRRNGRNLLEHIRRVNVLNKLDQVDGKGAYCNNGRKPKAEAVMAWRKVHPDGTKAQCIKDTGLSKPTVYKW